MFFMKFGSKSFFCLSILCVSLITVEIHVFKADAADLISECFNISQKLGYDNAVCQGHFDDKFFQNISKSSKVNTPDNLQFSISLRKLGYLDQSSSILKTLNHENKEILLAKANLDKAFYLRSASIYKATNQSETKELSIKNAIEKGSEALDIYYRLGTENIKDDNNLENSVVAKLNFLSLFSELGNEYPELSKIRTLNLDKALFLISSLDSNLNNLEKSKQILARLNLAETIINLNINRDDLLKISDENINYALSSTNDIFISSKSYGLRGKLLEFMGQDKNAIIYFEKAANLASSINNPELAYQWDYQLARLYAKSNERTAALVKYENTITSLENIRNLSISLKPELQYEFRDKIKPIYLEYLDYLFKSNKPNLQKIIKVNELLQVGELENYLQCGNLGLTSLLELSKNNLPDATIYLIRLPNKFAIILKNKDGSLYSHLADKQTIDIAVKRIHLSLQSENIRQTSEITFQELFQTLDQAVISPVERYLPKNGTLVFALDSDLQNIPWSLLYDGKRYLLEKYSVAYALGTRITPPKSLPKVEGLIAGIDNFPKQPSFAPLPNVDNEIKEIRKTISGTQVLLNKEFTEANLLFQGQGKNVIHLATHGQFSSDPNNTFILGWNKKISLQTIQQLIRGRAGKPLELLVLSACSTAEGDNRATLGIAGTAIQAGARSIVASLWTVDDASQVKLMQGFYEALKQGHSKADSLRIAQLKLMRSDKFHNPYYYGGIILIGSWL